MTMLINATRPRRRALSFFLIGIERTPMIQCHRWKETANAQSGTPVRRISKMRWRWHGDKISMQRRVNRKANDPLIGERRQFDMGVEHRANPRLPQKVAGDDQSDSHTNSVIVHLK
jgi:hypothetical protein